MRHSPVIAAAIFLLAVSPVLALGNAGDALLSQGKPPGPSPGSQPGKPGVASPAPLPAKPRALAPGEMPPHAQQTSSGSGFVIAERRVMTNHHVVENCTYVRLRTTAGRDIDAQVVRSDADRDLAVLSIEVDIGPALAFRSGPEVRRGEAVITYGFPLAGLLSSGPTLTTGDISALAGLSDNMRQYQISAPVQPGNSGGPVLDLAGNVVGIVVSKLNAQRIAARTGDIPQNVNFAVKSSEALEFLRGLDIAPRLAATTALRPATEVGEVAHPSTVFVRCLR